MKQYLPKCGAGFLIAAAIYSLPALSQATGPQQCAAFSALGDQHAQKAQGLLNTIEADSKNLGPDEITRLVMDRSAAANTESELANLAREAYKKCLTDYLAGGAPASQPVAAPPMQQAAPPPMQQAPMQQAPVQQVQPVQQAPRQVYRPQRQQIQQQPQQSQQQEAPSLFRPGGLIELGIGIGIGRALRDRQQ